MTPPRKKSGNYFKPEVGENRLRVISRPTRGFVGWVEEEGKRRPVRYAEGSKPKGVDAKYFWAFSVWDFGTACVSVWEVTQQSVLDQLEGLLTSPDWGCPTQYDLTVIREGTGLKTRYRLQPGKRYELPEDVLAKIASTYCDPDALLLGESPFEEPSDES